MRNKLLNSVLCYSVVQFLKDAEITQTEFAKAYGCEQNYLNQMLKERKPFDLEKLEKALLAYNQTISITIDIKPQLETINLSED